MIGVKLPDGRTISVQTDDPQEAARAGRRLLAREAILKGPQGSGSKTGLPKDSAFGAATDAAAHGATFGLDDVMGGGLAAGVTSIKNLIGRAQGKTPTYGAADAYAAERKLLKDRRADFNDEHPVIGGGAGLLGSLGSAGAGPVSSFVAKGAGAAKGAGLLDGLLHSAALPARMLRGAAVSAPLGALSGAAEADPGDEVNGAAKGAGAAALTGAAVPVAGTVLSKAAGAVKGAGTELVRATNKASGGKLLDAQKTAAQRLTQALKADGASPADLKTVLNTWLKSGASSPSLMDLAAKLPSGGANTMRLLTGAAMKGTAAGKASAYADDVAASLPDNVIARARKLTPDTRPAGTVAAELKGRQRALATEQYAEPYATPVPVTEDIAAAVRDEPGQAAIRRAIKGAIARQDYDAAGRLHSLLGLDVPDVPQLSESAMQRVRAASIKTAPDVTAGDLDRVKIAMGERGEGALRGQAPARDVASGLFDRAGQLDTALEAVPEIQPARQTYKAMQGQRNAVDVGGDALTMPPDEYEAEIAKLRGMATPDGNPHPVSEDDILGAAGVGHRQAITDAVGAPAAGSTGVLNRLRGSPNLARTQDATFGPEQGQGFRDAVGNELSRVKNARLIDPTLNSRTAGRLDALASVEPPRLSATGMIMGLVDKVRRGATLTDEERHAIVHLGLSQPHVLDVLHEEPQPILDALMRSGAYFAAPAGAQAGRAVNE